MKFKLAALLGFVLAAMVLADEAQTAKAGSLAFLDAQYGFRDLKFEQAMGSIPGLTLLEDDGDLKFYARPSDVLEQGGVKLKSLEYSFYKGKLAGLTMNVADGADPAPLFKSLETEYGPARRAPSKPVKYYWFGKKVLVDYWSGGIGRGTVGFWSKPLQALQMADRKALGK